MINIKGKDWDYEKPTEPGIYLACYGDVEVVENIIPFRLVDDGAINTTAWQEYTRADVQAMRGYKYCRVGVNE